MVSKPVAPPWNDSSKNFVRALALSGERFDYHVLTPRGQPLPGPRIRSEPVYGGRGRFTPALQQNLRALRRLLQRDHCALAHFFFAPNPRATRAIQFGLRVRPRRTVQTDCSIPESFRQPTRLLFADTVVVLSRHTHRCFAAAGVATNRLRHIPPGIDVPPLPSPNRCRAVRRRYGLSPDGLVALYAGDYQFSRAAETVARAVPRMKDVEIVFACRIKQPASRDEQRRIDAMLRSAGVRGRVRMIDEVDDMLALIGACDLALLPAESLYAKMDLPLVMLEAMALQLPIVVADVPPLDELLVDELGAAVPAQQPEALARAVGDLQRGRQARRRMGERAREAVKQHFSIARVSRAYEQLYGELIERGIR